MAKQPVKSQDELRLEVNAEIQKNVIPGHLRSAEKYKKTADEKLAVKSTKKSYAKEMRAKVAGWLKKGDHHNQKIVVW